MDKSIIRKTTLDELADWSPWPARIISLDPFEVKHKNPSAINREFGVEKWGALLDFFSTQDTFTLANVEEKEQNPDELIPCYESNIGFYIARSREANKRQINIYHDILKGYADGASSLVELGAGYGSKIFRLSDTAFLNDLPLYAAEYTQSGCDLTKLISKKIISI